VQWSGAAALVLSGMAVAAVRTRGYRVPAWRRLEAFSPWQFIVIEHVARRIVAPDRSDPDIPSADDADVAGFADGFAARMNSRTRKDLGRFLAYVEHVAPLVAGLTSRFTRMTAKEQDDVLASIEASSNDRLRGGFDGLKSLVFMGYYRDPRTWSILGYDGPLVGRPRAGWR
jgi:hypothetical protein